MNETPNNLLLRFDSMQGINSGVRDLQESGYSNKRAIRSLELVDVDATAKQGCGH